MKIQVEINELERPQDDLESETQDSFEIDPTSGGGGFLTPKSGRRLKKAQSSEEGMAGEDQGGGRGSRRSSIVTMLQRYISRIFCTSPWDHGCNVPKIPEYTAMVVTTSVPF